MKSIYLVLALMMTISSHAQNSNFDNLKSCKFYQSFVDSGWVVHDPDTFRESEYAVVTVVTDGLNSGRIIHDMSGKIGTDKTVGNKVIMLDAVMYDSLSTSRDTMYGDFAILQWQNTISEVRWYDGKNRNISINPEVLTCMSEFAPTVSNSVL